MSWIFSISDSTKVALMVSALEVIIKAGRHMQIISLSSSSFNMLLAIDGFLTDSVGLGITNLILSIGGFIFVLQLYNTNKKQHHKTNFNTKPLENIKMR